MKKLTTLLAMLLLAAACSGDDNDDGSASDPNPEDVTVEPQCPELANIAERFELNNARLDNGFVAVESPPSMKTLRAGCKYDDPQGAANQPVVVVLVEEYANAPDLEEVWEFYNTNYRNCDEGCSDLDSARDNEDDDFDSLADDVIAARDIQPSFPAAWYSVVVRRGLFVCGAQFVTNQIDSDQFERIWDDLVATAEEACPIAA